MDQRGADGSRKRVLQIAALALVWGIGILAVLCERSASAPAHHCACSRAAR